METTKGRLFLIPTIISENSIEKVITTEVRSVITQLDYFLVENIRTTRRFISKLNLPKIIESIQFEVLDKKTDAEEVYRLLAPVLKGKNVGIMSESGCPGVADPGAIAIATAHRLGIQVIPLVGPSSILLALMASGFNGQKFKFHGYLPIDKKERIKTIHQLEKESLQNKQTQIFIETPYRNEKLLIDIIKNCQDKTNLCIAKDLTGKQEFIRTLPVEKWRSTQINIHKIPVIFLIYAAN